LGISITHEHIITQLLTQLLAMVQLETN